jgi:hypothetical protein
MLLVLAAQLLFSAPNSCGTLDARILKRRQFLAIRQREKLLNPYDSSAFCRSHTSDEDCQVPTGVHDQRDVSREVSEYEGSGDGGPPETDEVIVPLLRRRAELKCKGEAPKLPPPE